MLQVAQWGLAAADPRGVWLFAYSGTQIAAAKLADPLETRPGILRGWRLAFTHRQVMQTHTGRCGRRSAAKSWHTAAACLSLACGIYLAALAHPVACAGFCLLKPGATVLKRAVAAAQGRPGKSAAAGQRRISTCRLGWSAWPAVPAANGRSPSYHAPAPREQVSLLSHVQASTCQLLASSSASSCMLAASSAQLHGRQSDAAAALHCACENFAAACKMQLCVWTWRRKHRCCRAMEVAAETLGGELVWAAALVSPEQLLLAEQLPD